MNLRVWGLSDWPGGATSDLKRTYNIYIYYEGLYWDYMGIIETTIWGLGFSPQDRCCNRIPSHWVPGSRSQTPKGSLLGGSGGLSNNGKENGNNYI